MLSVALVVSTLALATPVEPLDPVVGSPVEAVLAQADALPPPPPVEEGFDTEAPPPPPPPDEDLKQAPPPDVEGDGVYEEPEESQERRRKRGDESEGLDPMLTGAAQIGAGVATCAVCGLAGTGISCVVSLLTLPLAAIPFLGTLVSGALGLTLCSATGGAVGAVEAAVGNLIGEEEAGYFWPMAAGAGVGAAYASLSLVIALVQTALGVASGTATPPLPGTPTGPNPLAAATTPLSVVFGLATIGLCTVACLATPIVPAVVYGMVAVPKGSDELTVREDTREEVGGPARTRVASAMPF